MARNSHQDVGIRADNEDVFLTLSRIPALRQKMVDQLTEVNLHYVDGPLSVSRHSAQRLSSGDRAPNVAVRRLDDAVSDLYRELHSGSFVVLFVGVAALELPETLSSLAIPVSAMEPTAYEQSASCRRRISSLVGFT